MSAARTGWATRIGLALVHPRWALAVAGDREHPGRSGSDLIALFGVLLVATQLRSLVAAAWIGSAVDVGLGGRATVRVITRALTADLAFLVIGALALWAVGGARRRIGRAFDLACVAAVPLIAVDVAAVVVVRAIGFEVPPVLGWGLALASYGWAGAVLTLGWRAARLRGTTAIDVPAEVARPARRVGRALLGVAALGVAIQVAWIAGHAELLRPITQGDAAPAFALPQVAADGSLGAPVALADHRGGVVIVDFWATWCGPCLAALPRLDALVHQRPGLTVLAINLDDAKAARALFDAHHYALTLLVDDGEVSQRYGVTTIPHTVVIDPSGAVRGTLHDDDAAELAAILQK